MLGARGDTSLHHRFSFPLDFRLARANARPGSAHPRFVYLGGGGAGGWRDGGARETRAARVARAARHVGDMRAVLLGKTNVFITKNQEARRNLGRRARAPRVRSPVAGNPLVAWGGGARGEGVLPSNDLAPPPLRKRSPNRTDSPYDPPS